MSASLHSYFADLLKQTGPVRVDDTKFTEAMGSLDPECHKLVARSVTALLSVEANTKTPNVHLQWVTSPMVTYLMSRSQIYLPNLPTAATGPPR